MLATSTFAAPFGFVVWTIPSLYASAVWSLHLLPRGQLGSGLACLFREVAFPEFDRFYWDPRYRRFQQPVWDRHADESV